MIVKRKLYSVIDEEGNLGYYLYDESTGEERMFATFSPSQVASLSKSAPKLNASAYKNFWKNAMNDGAKKQVARSMYNGATTSAMLKPNKIAPDVNTMINRRQAGVGGNLGLGYGKIK